MNLVQVVFLCMGAIICSAVGGVLVWWLTPVSEISFPGSHVSLTGRKLVVTYSDFISVLLTTLTIVLGVLAIGVAGAAAYTIRNITVLANKAVDEKVNEAMARLETMVAQVAFGTRSRLGQYTSDENEER